MLYNPGKPSNDKALSKANAIVWHMHRRMVDRGTPVHVDAQDIASLFEAAHWRCIYSLLPCTTGGGPLNMTVDHITPLSLGGSNDLTNLIPCSSHFNNLKNNKPLSVFLDEIHLPAEDFWRRWDYIQMRSMRLNVYQPSY